MKKNLYKISVIIPIYDVEDYLLECLTSVINQSLKEVEIICIDDCSPANEFKIIQNLQNDDKRINYIRHTKNLNQGGARNSGINNASGEYIFFLDADDWIEPNCLEILYSKAKETNANIISYEFNTYNHNKSYFSEFKSYENINSGWIDITPENFNILQRVCFDKLYKSDIFYNKDIRFPENTKIEDIEFYWKLFTINKKAFHIKKILYHYRVRENSTMSKINDENFYLNFINITKEIYNYIKKENIIREYEQAYNDRINMNLNYILNNQEKYIYEIYNFLKGKDINFDNFILNSAKILKKKSINHISFNKKAILFGFNNIAKLFYEMNKNFTLEIVDSYKYGQKFNNLNILNFEEIKDIKNCFFIITANNKKYIEEIRTTILLKFPHAEIINLKNNEENNFISSKYWERRYKKGGNSGSGSYNHLAEFKAEIINNFISKNKINSVLELGCGDGNNLALYNIKNYIGVDVSKKAIELCKIKFKEDKTKTFQTLTEFESQNKKISNVELSLSLDVIYHLIEDHIYHEYMNNLFNSSLKYVIIYASNYNEIHSLHVKHRKFSNWIKKYKKDWYLKDFIKNRYEYDINKPKETTFADFYIFEKKI